MTKHLDRHFLPHEKVPIVHAASFYDTEPSFVVPTSLIIFSRHNETNLLLSCCNACVPAALPPSRRRKLLLCTDSFLHYPRDNLTFHPSIHLATIFLVLDAHMRCSALTWGPREDPINLGRRARRQFFNVYVTHRLGYVIISHLYGM